jgi:hypothetical protein
MLRKGLRDDVKDELIRYGGRVDTLEELVEAASLIGDRLYARAQERKYDQGKGKTTVSPNFNRPF